MNESVCCLRKATSAEKFLDCASSAVELDGSAKSKPTDTKTPNCSAVVVGGRREILVMMMAPEEVARKMSLPIFYFEFDFPFFDGVVRQRCDFMALLALSVR